MSNFDSTIITNLINLELNRAEANWENLGSQMIIANEGVMDGSLSYRSKAESMPSHIPGYPTVSDDNIVVDEFISLVMDMRNSSDHLLCARSEKHSRVSLLQRVYYETSALLPAAAATVKFSNGNVTEYLGDGVLAFFKVDADNKKNAVYSALDASKDIIDKMLPIFNQIISDRYDLPEIQLGVGMAYSKSMLTLTGLPNERHPKTFGENVFRATKLSYGHNQIFIDDKLKAIWPITDNGKMKFNLRRKEGLPNHYLIS